MADLFSPKPPLPYRLAPENFDEFVGQTHIVGEGKPLRLLIGKDRLFSCVFWGPPGTGKTALARLVSRLTGSAFVEMNAVTSTVGDLRKVLEQGRRNFKAGVRTVVLIDEIHRFNRVQQDALLPDLESGSVVLIGTSTENPYFSLTPALRSRVKLYEFYPLSPGELKKLYALAVSKKAGLPGFSVPEDVLEHLIRSSSGDARKFLSYLEELYEALDGAEPDIKMAEEVTGRAFVRYSRADEHYDVVSAFIKSIRGSDPDASIYYLARMLVGGEDPMFIARRLVILASEDIGNANPEALTVAVSAMEAVSKVGMPEASINLAQAVLYLAMSPKSNSVYRAIKKAMEDVESGVNLPVPPHLKHGFKGKGYKYPHDYPRHWVKQSYLSEGRKYYESSRIGFEKQLDEWLKWMRGG